MGLITRKQNLLLLLVLVGAILVSFLLYEYTVCPNISSYGDSLANRVYHIFEFYENLSNSSSILLLGSSQMMDAVDAVYVENKIDNRLTVFNLGESADTPSRRLLELDKITKLRPRAVIIGISLFSVNDYPPEGISSFSAVKNSLNPESSSLILIREDLQGVFTSTLIEKVSGTVIPLPQKKCIRQKANEGLSFIRYYLRKLTKIFTGDANVMITENVAADLKSPYAKSVMGKNQSEFERDLNSNKELLGKYLVDPFSNKNKNALLYTIGHLKNNNITVIVVNLPLSPYFNERIPVYSLDNFNDFVQTAILPLAPYYDFREYYDSTYFYDNTHLRNHENFSEQIADILHKEVIDVVQ